jgi:hypothetical protein
MYHIWRRGELHTEFWWGNLRERDHVEHLGIDGRIILKRILREWNGAWLGIGRDGGLL